MAVIPIDTSLRALRYTYAHVHGCKAVSTVVRATAEELSQDHCDIEEIYCTGCRTHRPIEQFVWVASDGSPSNKPVRREENSD